MNASSASNFAAEPLQKELIFAVLSPKWDGFGFTGDDYPALRKSFFENGGKTVRLNKSGVIKGLEGKIRGKMSGQGMYWKKTAGSADIEESFMSREGYLVVKRNFDSVITARIHFDKNHRWLKSEYYETGFQTAVQPASVIFRPTGDGQGVKMLTFCDETHAYRAVPLFCAPCPVQPSKQSIINARFGTPLLLLYTKDGSYCYCQNQEEATLRQEALAELDQGTVLLLPAWEVRNGEIATEAPAQETNICFPAMDKPAVLPEQTALVTPAEQAHPSPAAAVQLPKAAKKPQSAAETTVNPPLAHTQTEEHPPVAVPPAKRSVPKVSTCDPDYTQILEAAKKLKATAARESPSEDTDRLSQTDTGPSLPDDMAFDGDTELSEIFSAIKTALEQKESDTIPPELSKKLANELEQRVHMEQPGGPVAYEGGYLDGKRQGFGAYYYKDGSLCYAGFWEQDKKEGLGVSFRHSDQAAHVSNWKNGQPCGFTSLFDSNGTFKYGGKIINGKKEGVGISLNAQDGSVFVGKWEDGKHTGHGSSFDQWGNLLYTGMWENGKRNGNGTAFDENGDVLFTGEWKDDREWGGILYKKPRQEAEGE